MPRNVLSTITYPHTHTQDGEVKEIKGHVAELEKEVTDLTDQLLIKVSPLFQPLHLVNNNLLYVHVLSL